MDDTNGSYFFCFLLFHLILPLPHLFMSCFIPYAPLPLTLCCSLFHLSLLHPQSHSLPPTIPPHTSSPSLPLSLSLSLSLCSGAAQPVGSSRAPAALHRARSGTQRQLPGSPVCGHPPAPWREGTDIPHTCSQTLAIWREESWVERPRERKSMQMAWFTSTCSFSVSENRNVVSDILCQTQCFLYRNI